MILKTLTTRVDITIKVTMLVTVAVRLVPYLNDAANEFRIGATIPLGKYRMT